MLENLVSHERRNIRPFVLGLCFICGLIFGFVFYVATPSFAVRQAVQDDKDRKLEADRVEKNRGVVVPVQTIPNIVSLDRNTTSDKPALVDVDPSKTVIEDDRAGRDDMRKLPDPLAVAMRFDSGLSGRTTYRPLKPVQVDKPAPPLDFGPRSATTATTGGGKKAGKSDGEAELPELDD